MIYIISNSTNPYFNLALEEYFFNTTEDEVFILWQNKNTVVIGKYQNTIEEINLQYVKDHDIKVARRLSGGGAVYHDLGNVNFTFINSKDANKLFDFEYFTNVIVEFLKTQGIDVCFNSRNDLTINGKKFSGNSQYIKKNRILHHGTLLFDSDLEELQRVLKVSDTKIVSKAISSVRERVTNIKDFYTHEMSIDRFKNELIDYMKNKYDMQEYILNENDITQINKSMKDKYETWEWNYGYSPDCSIVKKNKFAGGSMQIYIDLNDGIIKKFKIYGDFFVNGDLSDFENMFIDKQFNENGIKDVVKKVDNFINGIDSNELLNVILYK